MYASHCDLYIDLPLVGDGFIDDSVESERNRSSSLTRFSQQINSDDNQNAEDIARKIQERYSRLQQAGDDDRDVVERILQQHFHRDGSAETWASERETDRCPGAVDELRMHLYMIKCRVSVEKYVFLP